jgi:hypothetical protein
LLPSPSASTREILIAKPKGDEMVTLPVIHSKGFSSYRKVIGITIGLSYQVTVEIGGGLLPSDRKLSYQVTVDNLASGQTPTK